MTLNQFLQLFVPKDTKFFPLFQEAYQNLIELSSALHEVVNLKAKQREDYFKKIEHHKGIIDGISHKMNVELSRNFITPFDREDIHSLMSRIYELADNMHSAAHRMQLYQVDKITKPIRKMTEVTVEACQLIGEATNGLKDFQNTEDIKIKCKQIAKLENKADSLFNKSVADLFENETDVKSIIIYKEVMSALEKASDSCKDVASILESIAIKHS